MKNFKVGIVQMNVGNDKVKNIEKAIRMIKEAADNGAELVLLPEIFMCPYNNQCFSEYAEEFPGETSKAMMKAAKESSIYLLAGSIPEKSDGKIYNSSYFYNREGVLIAKHRKMHLFDINIEGGQKFKESDVLTPGDDFTVVDTDLGKIGIAICYDVRFPEYFRAMTMLGAEVVLLPAAFNMTTGPAHWEMSIRMRAVDNQIYMIAAAPARDESSSYVSYANSMVVSPWGTIEASAGIDEKILYSEVNSGKLAKVRKELPLLKHLRKDKYALKINV
ncbi:MAG: carbon-nitrogen hydrolase family protein [Peptostreptococcus sp.]|uniref:carbon-nitrogen hydrolase family protein n=1 Tax=Peptostreptococcus sp. TaxID=1262 RepID=UPI002FCA39F6